MCFQTGTISRPLLQCSLLKTQHMGKTHRKLQRLGASCFYQEIVLYQIPNIAFVHMIWRGRGIPCSSQCFEMVLPAKAREHFPALPSQLVQPQGRSVLLPPWLSLMLAVDLVQDCKHIYVRYLGPESIALLLATTAI